MAGGFKSLSEMGTRSSKRGEAGMTVMSIMAERNGLWGHKKAHAKNAELSQEPS